MNAEAVVEKATAIYVEMTEVEKEKEMHETRSRECKKRIEGMEAQIRELVNGVDSAQEELSLDAPTPEGIFPCVDGEEHEWELIRDDERSSVESCEKCYGTREIDKAAEKQEWIYSFPASEAGDKAPE